MDVDPPRAPAPTAGGAPAERDELVLVRAGAWRLLVPLRQIERVLSAALPSARPSLDAGAPVLAVGGVLVPVVFAGALLGAAEVKLAASDQMVLLADGGRRALLWVDAVEDVVAHAPAAPPPGAAPGDLVLSWSGADRPLAILDVARLLALVTHEVSKGEA